MAGKGREGMMGVYVIEPHWVALRASLRSQRRAYKTFNLLGNTAFTGRLQRI